MVDRDKSADSALDRNLRLIGKNLALPAEPSDAQQRSWKSAARPAHSAPLARGVQFMRRHLILTVAGAGTAAAACLAFVALVLTPTAQPRVQAVTIFQSFRQTLTSGFKVTLTDLKVDDAEDTVVGAEFLMVMDPMKQFPDLAPEKDPPAYVEGWLSVRKAASPEKLVDMTLAASTLPNEEWFYLKADHLPIDDDAADNPIAAYIISMLKDGVLLELRGLYEHSNKLDADIAKQLQSSHGGADDDSAVADKRDVALRVGMNIGQQSAALMSAGTAKGEEGGALADLELKFDKSLNVGGKSFMTADELRLAKRVDEIANRMLSGHAGLSDVQELVAMIEQSASRVSISEVEPGLWVLTAAEFKFDPSLPGAEDLAALSNAELRIAYREGTGVPWATLDHLGTSNGSIRLESVDWTPDPARLNKQRLVDKPGTRVFDLSWMINMIGFEVESTGG